MGRIPARGVGGLVAASMLVMSCSSDSTAPAPAPVPAAIVVVSGNNQNALYNETAALPLVVRVVDAGGAPVAGASVSWAAIGGGTVSATSTETNASGQTSVTRTIAGTMSGYTTVASLPADTSATAYFVTLGTAVPSTYSVDVQFLTPVTATQRAAFLDAAARWSSIIVADFPADLVVADSASCDDNTPPINQSITSVVIYATIAPIDGPGGILGGASPCWVRQPSILPLVGTMTFDAADMALIEANGVLKPVILHEMGHVLGIGTIWDYVTPSLLIFGGTDSTHFDGVSANTYYAAADGVTSFPNLYPVPVENTGGPGTQDGHWRETVMTTELMTGYLALGSNPLSAITIGSLEDLGYTVNFTTADPFVIAPSPFGAAANVDQALRLRELGRRGPIHAIDRQGRITRMR
ncbi:MAG: leishmanolysin-related zinc metalloendopeptidase [Gemmatimonadales bacterium]